MRGNDMRLNQCKSMVWTHRYYTWTRMSSNHSFMTSQEKNYYVLKVA